MILYTFCLSLQPLLELGSKSTFLSSGLWMLPKQCDTICWYIAYSQILFCTFYLLLQPLLELGSKSTSLSSGFSDVIKAARYDLLIPQQTTLEIREILLLCEIFRGCYLYNLNPLEVIRLVSSLQLAVLYPKSHCLISWSGFIPGNVGRMDAIVRCGRCLAGGRGCLLKGPHLIPSLKFRLPYLINVHQSINHFLLKSRGMKYCPSGKTPRLINACGSLNCSFIMTSVMLTTFTSYFTEEKRLFAKKKFIIAWKKTHQTPTWLAHSLPSFVSGCFAPGKNRKPFSNPYFTPWYI